MVLVDQVVVALVLVSTTLDEAEIEDIAVARIHQSKGLATKLLKHVFSVLKTHKVNTVFLEVASDNSAALTLYSKCSFQQIGVRKAYYHKHDGSCADAIVMQKVL